MVITYHGGEFFKVVFGATTLALNPISKSSKWKPSKFGADIALVSLNHADFNGIEQVTLGEKEPFVIEGPGEYERAGVFIKGFGAPATYAGKSMINTIYTVELEGMHLVFLGALGDRKLSSEIKGELPDIDILFVPIGGGDVLSASDAHELSVELETKIVIPMHFEEKDSKTFVKTEGGNGKPIEKLTIKRKDLEGKTGEIVVLSH
jgi:hypothetical protein